MISLNYGAELWRNVFCERSVQWFPSLCSESTVFKCFFYKCCHSSTHIRTYNHYNNDHRIILSGLTCVPKKFIITICLRNPSKISHGYYMHINRCILRSNVYIRYIYRRFRISRERQLFTGVIYRDGINLQWTYLLYFCKS